MKVVNKILSKNLASVRKIFSGPSASFGTKTNTAMKIAVVILENDNKFDITSVKFTIFFGTISNTINTNIVTIIPRIEYLFLHNLAIN